MRALALMAQAASDFALLTLSVSMGGMDDDDDDYETSFGSMI